MAVITAVFLFKLSIRGNTKVPDSEMLHANSSVVARSDDSRALGYPDQRKLVRTQGRMLLAAYRSKDRSRSSSYQIYVSQSRDDGTSWHTGNGGKPLSGNLGTYDQRVPDLLSAGSAVYVAWYGADQQSGGNDEHQVYFASSSDGGNSFSPPKTVGHIAGYDQQDTWQEHPVLFTDKGRIYVVWEGKDQTHKHPQIKISYSDDEGKNWHQPANINPDPALSYSRPSLIRQEAKLWLFCYGEQKQDSSVSVAAAAVSTDNGAHWTPWQQISGGQADSRHITTTLDKDGRLFAAFRVYQGGKSRIAYRTVAAGSDDWSDQKFLPSTGDSQFFPSLGTLDGRVYLAYSLLDAKDAGAPKEDLTDGSLVQLAVYDADNSAFKQVTGAVKGSWLTLPRSGNAVESLSENPDGGNYRLVYTRYR